MTTAVARHAFRTDEVESDYLPLRLLDRSWVGEFDT